MKRRDSLFLFTSALLGAVAPLSGQAFDHLGEELSPLAAVSRAVARSGSVLERIWPGFAPPEFVMCRSDGWTITVLRGASPSDQRRQAAGEPPITADLEIEVLREPPQALVPVCFSFDFTIRGHRVLAVPAQDSIFGIANPETASLVMLFHEAFHLFQEQYFAPTGDPAQYEPLEEPRLPLTLIESSRFEVLAAEERDLLIAALGAPQKDSLVRILSAYLSTRDARVDLGEESLSTAEGHNERKEGSAMFVGLEAAAGLTGAPAHQTREWLLSYLTRSPGGPRSDYWRSAYRSWHLYATGGALCLLLDDLDVSWREKVQSGATPIGLIRDFVRRQKDQS